MRTKDGKDVIVGKYYYLENGQQVSLESCATTPEGKTMFLVIPFYEGETMEANGDGGSHHEISIDYEHEGEPMLVSAIFDEAPLAKLCEKYKSKLNEVEHLALSVGVLAQELKLAGLRKSKLTKEMVAVEELYVSKAKIGKATAISIELFDKKLAEKRQQLSELEDSIGDMKSEDVSILASKTEFQRLNKRDFELQCLEEGGVDNWEWYGDSLKKYHERYPA